MSVNLNGLTVLLYHSIEALKFEEKVSDEFKQIKRIRLDGSLVNYILHSEVLRNLFLSRILLFVQANDIFSSHQIKQSVNTFIDNNIDKEGSSSSSHIDSVFQKAGVLSSLAFSGDRFIDEVTFFSLRDHASVLQKWLEVIIIRCSFFFILSKYFRLSILQSSSLRKLSSISRENTEWIKNYPYLMAHPTILFSKPDSLASDNRCSSYKQDLLENQQKFLQPAELLSDRPLLSSNVIDNEHIVMNRNTPDNIQPYTSYSETISPEIIPSKIQLDHVASEDSSLISEKNTEMEAQLKKYVNDKEKERLLYPLVRQEHKFQVFFRFQDERDRIFSLYQLDILGSLMHRLEFSLYNSQFKNKLGRKDNFTEAISSSETSGNSSFFSSKKDTPNFIPTPTFPDNAPRATTSEFNSLPTMQDYQFISTAPSCSDFPGLSCTNPHSWCHDHPSDHITDDSFRINNFSLSHLLPMAAKNFQYFSSISYLSKNSSNLIDEEYFIAVLEGKSIPKEPKTSESYFPTERLGSMKDATQNERLLQFLQNSIDGFVYWALHCLVAEHPDIGPRLAYCSKKKGFDVPDLQKKKISELWSKRGNPDKFPNFITSQRILFDEYMENLRILKIPTIVILHGLRYKYSMITGSIEEGIIDLAVYDKTNEKILLLVPCIFNNLRPRSTFTGVLKQRDRLVAVIRSAYGDGNQANRFQCTGYMTEFILDSKTEWVLQNPLGCRIMTEEDTFLSGLPIAIPLSAFQGFALSPVRFYVPALPWSAYGYQSSNNVLLLQQYFAISGLACLLASVIPPSFIQQDVLPYLSEDITTQIDLEEVVAKSSLTPTIHKKNSDNKFKKPEDEFKELFDSPGPEMLSPHPNISGSSDLGLQRLEKWIKKNEVIWSSILKVWRRKQKSKVNMGEECNQEILKGITAIPDESHFPLYGELIIPSLQVTPLYFFNRLMNKWVSEIDLKEEN